MQWEGPLMANCLKFQAGWSVGQLLAGSCMVQPVLCLTLPPAGARQSLHRLLLEVKNDN